MSLDGVQDGWTRKTQDRSPGSTASWALIAARMWTKPLLWVLMGPLSGAYKVSSRPIRSAGAGGVRGTGKPWCPFVTPPMAFVVYKRLSVHFLAYASLPPIRYVEITPIFQLRT